MVPTALATLDLVTHDDAQPAFPAVHLEGHAVLSYGELAGLVGESERVLRHDSKALVLCAGDRDLPTLLAYLAALRLGHAVAFLPASRIACLDPAELPGRHVVFRPVGRLPLTPGGKVDYQKLATVTDSRGGPG